MNARRKGSKKESSQGFSPWVLSFQSSLRSARRLLGLKGPLGNLEIVSDQHSIWIIYPRPYEASIAQRACFDSLLQGQGHFRRTKADGFDYQIVGALGTYQISGKRRLEQLHPFLVSEQFGVGSGTPVTSHFNVVISSSGLTLATEATSLVCSRCCARVPVLSVNTSKTSETMTSARAGSDVFRSS
jgi:hypothetical protein